MYDDEERERPSWREIDKKKDRSRFVREERPQSQSKKRRSIITNYRHKLKEAFKSGKVAEAIDRLEGDTPEKREKRENMKVLRSGEDPDIFLRALEWYINTKPDEIDADIIKKAIDFERDDITLKILTLLRSTKNLKEILMAPTIREKLNFILMTSRDLQIKYLIKEIQSLSER